MPRGRSTLVVDAAIDYSSRNPEGFAKGNTCAKDASDRGVLLRVKLDDQAFVDVGRQIAALRQGLEHAAALVLVDFEPGGSEIHLLRKRQRLLRAKLILRALGKRHLITGTDLI